MDEESDFQKEFSKNVQTNISSKTPTKKKDAQMKSETPISSYPKRVPGNSIYSSISSNGKKCAIF